MPPQDPDLPLVRALQAGEERALDELMKRHREPLFRFLWRYTRDETLARDLAQETFVRVYFHSKSFRPRATFSTWLTRIALNLCRDHARGRSARLARLSVPLDEASAESPPGEHMPRTDTPRARAESEEAVDRLEALIAELPHDLKSALLLTALEERSHKEAAELLETTPKAIETRVYRARRWLAEKLKPTRPA